jgi:hypothetical protein
MHSSPPQSTVATDDLIVDRYRIEAELGRGGMARVYRVLDERSGQRLALKQLVGAGEASATLQAMFEREYHTLVHLTHPRIVRAFEYGLSGDRPYYTMELLEGADARQTFRRTRPTLQQSCMLLRDVASALALIHSRRMVHRDVGARNVWCLPDGRAKLIDFGTLVAMGPQTRVAGTAPFVPPEALHMQPLDARCDIFALGALAYFILTGRHAYPARELSELRHVWQRPPQRPDAAGMPRSLVDLMMAMLSLDARGRPASAAEVIERLSAVCELPSDDQRHDAQAFLSTPKLVGRASESGALRKRLLRAMRGRGSTVALVAPAGLGRSRMLASVLVDAKLLGAAVIGVDASAVASGPFAVAAALAERLLETLPMTGAAVVDLAPVLGQVSPAVHRALGKPALAPLAAFERTRKLSSALVSLVEAATRSQRLLIAVDDVHRADDASLGVLGRLSLVAAENQLLLLTTCDAAALTHATPALEQLCQPRHRIELAPLAAEHTRDLLASLFGETAGLDDAARWLHELSQGSPQACLQYAQYLVDHGIARYAGGGWQLPARLRAHGLPPTLGAMFEARLATLSEDARSLALGLSLARDETRAAWQPELHIRIEDFAKLVDGDGARAFRALDELLQTGFVEQRDSFYVIAQRAMTDALLRATDGDVRRRAHARVASVLLQGGYHGAQLAVRHLQRAGAHERARELLVQSTTVSAGTASPYAWGAMRLSVLTECAIEALAHYQTHGGSPREGVQLRRPLMAACTVYDWSSARFGDAQLAQLRADAGLVYWDELDPALPPLARILQCIKRAQEEYDRKPEHERGFAPLEALKDLGAVSIGLSSAYMNMHDVARARGLPAMLEPMRPLTPGVDLLANICAGAVARVRGLELGDATLQAAEQLGQNSSLPDILRTGMSVILLHLHTVEEARRGRQNALERMDQLASLVGIDLFYVMHARWLAHAFRGKARLAESLRRQLEVISEDDVWRRKAFLFVEAQLYALTGDMPSLRRTCEQIAELAEKFPGWRPWLAWTRAELHRLHGDLDAAEQELTAALAEAAPGEHRAWVLAAPAYAELLLARGDAGGALEQAREIRQSVRALSLDRSAEVAAERVSALAASRHGHHGEARASLARAFELAHELGYDGLPLARLYEANAAIALAEDDSQACNVALEQLGRLLEHAEAPALFQAYEALCRAAARTPGAANARVSIPVTRNPVTVANDTATEVQARLSVLDSRQQRAQQALQLLLDDRGARAGHLFLFDAGGPIAAASIGGHAGEALLASVEHYLQAELQETKTAVITSADSTADARTIGALTEAAVPLVPVLLRDTSGGQNLVVGVALLALDDAAASATRPELVQAIARCLIAAGDSLPLPGDDD